MCQTSWHSFSEKLHSDLLYRLYNALAMFWVLLSCVQFFDLGFLTFSPNFFTSSSGKPVGSYAWTWSLAVFLANLRQKKVSPYACMTSGQPNDSQVHRELATILIQLWAEAETQLLQLDTRLRNPRRPTRNAVNSRKAAIQAIVDGYDVNARVAYCTALDIGTARM